MWCALCNEYLGFLSVTKFCHECCQLRRIYLLYDKEKFIEKIKTIFLKEDKKQENKIEYQNNVLDLSKQNKDK